MREKTKTRLFSAAFLLPVLVVYSVFLVYPIVSSLHYSLTSWNGVGDKNFVGLQNYATLFASSDFWTVFGNTMQLVGITLLVQVPVGLIVAYLLYNKCRGWKIFRTVFFLPVVIAPVAIGLMFSLFYNSEIGIFNLILETIGLGGLKRNWLSDKDTLLYAVMAPQVWQYIGLYITIFLAALQAIPEELLESAQIDGAGRVRTFFYIVIPQLRSFLQICVILCVTGSLKSFEHAWVMTGGGPGVRSSYLGVYMYKTAFNNSNFGMGSAIAINIVLLSFLFTALVRLLLAEKEEQ